jgi:hypothetical protein
MKSTDKQTMNIKPRSLFGAGTNSRANPEEFTPSIGRTLLESCEITLALPQKLSTKPDGRPIASTQIAMLPKNAQPSHLAQQAQLLMAPQPIGGHEPMVNAMRDELAERALKTIFEKLVSEHQSFAKTLRETRDAALVYRANFEAELREARQRLDESSKTLRRYQEDAAKSSGSSTSLVDFARRMIGNYVRLTEAIKAFNDRETFHLKCDAQRASMEVLAQIVLGCERVLSGLETTRATAQAGVQEATQRAEQIEREAAKRGRIADHVVATDRVVAGVCVEDNDAPYLQELIVEARDNGSIHVIDCAKQIAQRIVSGQLDPLGIVDLIRLEANGTQVNGKSVHAEVAPLIVGAHVLEAARRKHAGLRLTRDARPREFTFQVISGQQPVFSHPSLGSAAFRKPQDEFAFVWLQTDIALNELQIIREGEREFRDTLMKREYFIIEEVARAWRPMSMTHAETASRLNTSPVMDGEMTPTLAVGAVGTTNMMPSANGSNSE